MIIDTPQTSNTPKHSMAAAADSSSAQLPPHLAFMAGVVVTSAVGFALGTIILLVIIF